MFLPWFPASPPSSSPPPLRAVLGESEILSGGYRKRGGQWWVGGTGRSEVQGHRSRKNMSINSQATEVVPVNAEGRPAFTLGLRLEAGGPSSALRL